MGACANGALPADRAVTGRFITLEGGEGVGKSTQIRALAAALEARGVAVVATREPGGSAGAEAIRTLLMEGSDDRWDARSEALLFAAARADHVARTIRPALARGAWVLCDRFVDLEPRLSGRWRRDHRRRSPRRSTASARKDCCPTAPSC